jgi:hypothetical protein
VHEKKEARKAKMHAAMALCVQKEKRSREKLAGDNVCFAFSSQKVHRADMVYNTKLNLQ